jgi:uncharacterized damage-inducible protein DinB
MSIKEQLKYMVNVNKLVAGRILEDITEEESLVIIEKIPNHIRWQVGHMVYSAGFALMKLGDTKDDWEKLKSLFRGGNELAEDPSVYPSMAELRNWLGDIHDRTLKALDAVDEAALAEEVGEENQKRAAWQRYTFLYMHEFYHSGQIVQIRRALGRERPFG